MTCYDSCCYDDERIPSQFVSEKRVKSARKQHRCSSCLGVIGVGSSYAREFWIVDGEPTFITRHHGCLTY